MSHVNAVECCRLRTASACAKAELQAAHCAQVKGEVTIKEFSSIDPDEYAFEVSIERAEDAPATADHLKRGVQGLEQEVMRQLQQYVQELNASI